MTSIALRSVHGVGAESAPSTMQHKLGQPGQFLDAVRIWGIMSRQTVSGYGPSIEPMRRSCFVAARKPSMARDRASIAVSAASDFRLI